MSGTGTRQKRPLPRRSGPLTIKTEPTTSKIKPEPDSPLTDLSPAQSPAPTGPWAWENPKELDYVYDLELDIIQFLMDHCAFSIPGHQSNATLMTVQDVLLPARYRIPLMWLARYMWLSVQLVLTATEREKEWEMFRWSILHVGRLCKTLIDRARQEADRMNVKWRCAPFDRAMVRYRARWLIQGPEHIKDFWNMYGEEEYRKDVIGFEWKRWAIKGHKGFKLTDAEINNGIAAEEFTDGLHRVGETWYWGVIPPSGSKAPALSIAAPAPITPISPPASLPARRPLPKKPTMVKVEPKVDSPKTLLPRTICPPSPVSEDITLLGSLPTRYPPHPHPQPPPPPPPPPRDLMHALLDSFTSTCQSLTDEMADLRREVRALREETSLRNRQRFTSDDDVTLVYPTSTTFSAAQFPITPPTTAAKVEEQPCSLPRKFVKYGGSL